MFDKEDVARIIYTYNYIYNGFAITEEDILQELSVQGNFDNRIQLGKILYWLESTGVIRKINFYDEGKEIVLSGYVIAENVYVFATLDNDIRVMPEEDISYVLRYFYKNTERPNREIQNIFVVEEGFDSPSHLERQLTALALHDGHDVIKFHDMIPTYKIDGTNVYFRKFNRQPDIHLFIGINAQIVIYPINMDKDFTLFLKSRLRSNN